MNRDLSQIGYDTEELYFHEMNREKIERIKAERVKERTKLKVMKSEPEIPTMKDQDYEEAA